MNLEKVASIGMVSLALAGCADYSSEAATWPVYAPVAGPEKCENSVEEDPDYVKLVDDYFNKWELPKGWDTWMKDNYPRLCTAFKITQFHDKEVSLGVYDKSLSIYKEKKSPDGYMGKLEELLELTYPGWDWNLDYLGVYPGKLTVGIDEYDGFVLLGSNYNFTKGKAIQVHYPGIIVHEIGHRLGFPHHSDKLEDIGKGKNMPAGEKKCIMDRTSSQWGSSERAILEIDLDIDNSKEISLAVDEVHEVLEDNY